MACEPVTTFLSAAGIAERVAVPEWFVGQHIVSRLSQSTTGFVPPVILELISRSCFGDCCCIPPLLCCVITRLVLTGW